MNRRQFTKRAALTMAVAGLTGSAFKCGSEKVSIYVQTISSFLNEIAGILPTYAARIAQIVKVASDFDAAYRRGDFANASTFFNGLAENVATFTGDLGLTASSQVKIALAIVNASVRAIAVLLQSQGATQPAAVANAKASSKASARSISIIEKLAAPAAIDSALQAVKL